MPEYVSVCQGMPDNARVCQSMPEYSRVCQSLAKFCLFIAFFLSYIAVVAQKVEVQCWWPVWSEKVGWWWWCWVTNRLGWLLELLTELRTQSSLYIGWRDFRFWEIKSKHLLRLGSCDQNDLRSPYILGINNRDLASDVFWGIKLRLLMLMLMTMMRTKVEAQVLIYLFRKSVEQCNVS